MITYWKSPKSSSSNGSAFFEVALEVGGAAGAEGTDAGYKGAGGCELGAGNDGSDGDGVAIGMGSSERLARESFKADEEEVAEEAGEAAGGDEIPLDDEVPGGERRREDAFGGLSMSPPPLELADDDDDEDVDFLRSLL